MTRDLKIEALATKLQSVEQKLEDVSRLNRRELDMRLLEQLARLRRDIRYEVERRSRETANEAKSYADQSVFSLSSSMRAAHKVVYSTEKRTTILEQAFPEILSGVKAFEDRLTELGSYADKAGASVSAEIEALKDQMANSESYANRVEATARTQIQALEDRLTEIDARVVKVDANAQAETDARATQANSVNRFEKQVDIDMRNLERDLGQIKDGTAADLRNIERRLEFVRSEVMYELQVALSKLQSSNPEGRAKSEVVNTDKLADARRNGLRLNVGCGHIQLEDYINVDQRALPGVDIVAEAVAIPLEAGSVVELFSSHLVEHFPRHILERVLLPHWKSLLRPGGLLVTVAPDGAAMLAAVNAGEMSFEDFREVLFGGQDYDGDLHHNLITPDDYCETLQRCGFTEVTREYAGMRNGKCFEFKISARRH
ncbi:hypothetical protein Q5H94_15310 [Sphingomonas sp. CA1-15]|uniref:Methyltransferase domain-containing protein n=2 Tax=Sphingomonas immobilis TaxID=3063997 RepID=A0ABT9A1L7_9SPHN|nr:hypothetical protein [Sphingomonas sp. CA1-15]